jgi:hypothetical protein
MKTLAQLLAIELKKEGTILPWQGNVIVAPQGGLEDNR